MTTKNILGRALILTAVVAAAASISTNSTNSTNSTSPFINRTTATTTTTLPHKCILDAPCGVHSDCIPVDDNHICRCQTGFYGVESLDGEGCYRNNLAASNFGQEQGMLLSMGEGMDFFVKAGGERRGRKASILAMAEQLDKVIADTEDIADTVVANAAAVEQGLVNLDERLSKSVRDLEASVNGIVDTKLRKIEGDVLDNKNRVIKNLATAKQLVSEASNRLDTSIGKSQSLLKAQIGAVDQKVSTASKLATKAVQDAARAAQAGSAALPRSCQEYGEKAGLATSANLLALLWPADAPTSAVVNTFTATIYPNGLASGKTQRSCKLYSAFQKYRAGWQTLKGKGTKASSQCCGSSPARVVDGNTNGYWGGRSTSHTGRGSNPWIRVDLGQSMRVVEVRVWGRTDCCWSRSRYAQVWVTQSDQPRTGKVINRSGGSGWASRTSSTPVYCKVPGNGFIDGRFVYVRLSRRDYLQISEIQVYADPTIVSARVA